MTAAIRSETEAIYRVQRTANDPRDDDPHIFTEEDLAWRAHDAARAIQDKPTLEWAQYITHWFVAVTTGWEQQEVARQAVEDPVGALDLFLRYGQQLVGMDAAERPACERGDLEGIA